MGISEATEVARSEIQKQFNITDVIIKSSVLKNGMWYINTFFILNNEKEYYNIIINDTTNIIEGMRETKFNTRNTGSAQTFMLVALIFAVITVVVYAIISAITVPSAVAFTTVSASPPINPFAIVLVLVFLALLIVNVYILIIIIKIRRFIDNGDYKSAYYADSVLFGVLALLIGGIITGLMLLLARGELENAASN